VTSCSIVIPVHNRAALTSQCLDTLFATPSAEADVEIIVVDDGSTDTTQEILAVNSGRIEIVVHDEATGFATACNDGAAAASGEWLVFLNNDTIPEPGWLDALIDYASQREHIGVVGAKLLFPNRTIQHAGVVVSRELVPHHIYTGFPEDHPAVNKSREFQLVTAACALLRRQTFELAGRFDPQFVNGYEDVDLCLRLRREGYEVHYCHESVLYHLETSTRDHRLDPQNHALFLERWSDFVRQDDLEYFAEDGLIEITYWEQFPVLLTISPELAILDRDRAVESMLAQRSREAFDALKENTRLKIELREAQSRTAAHADVSGRH
jgi:GT2 family glycosyltransferase